MRLPFNPAVISVATRTAAGGRTPPGGVTVGTPPATGPGPVNGLLLEDVAGFLLAEDGSFLVQE